MSLRTKATSLHLLGQEELGSAARVPMIQRMSAHVQTLSVAVAARAPCSVFDLWMRWERHQEESESSNDASGSVSGKIER